jgi:hypothetical protein
MGFGCCGISLNQGRSFLTRDERISLLKEYKDDLEKEVKGISERIKDLEKE